MFRLNKPIDFSDYTLIIPSVSVGNVGQLTSDLLISTYNLQKIGTVWHKSIIPTCGSNPFDPQSTDNCLACELFESQAQKLVVMQLRSSIEPKLLQCFLRDLSAYLKEQKFAKVLILTSSFAYEMHNLSSGYYRYHTNTDLGKVLEEIRVLPLEIQEQGLIVHGCGFATKLYDILKDSMNVLMIVKYTSEGDNRPDAISMISILNNCLKLDKLERIVFPVSWDLVYGSPPPIGIY